MNVVRRITGRIADSSLFTKIMVAFVFFAILPLNIFYFVSVTTTRSTRSAGS